MYIDLQEIQAMKSRLEEYEKEAQQLREMREAQEREAKAIAEVAGPVADDNAMETEEDKQLVDGRSVYVGNVSFRCDSLKMAISQCFMILFQVDYSSTPEEIQAHFAACGTINRVTILCDKFTGHPKGYVCPAPTSQ